MNLPRFIDYNVLLIHIKQKSSLKIKQGHRSRGLGSTCPNCQKCVGKPVLPPPPFVGGGKKIEIAEM